MRRSCRTVATAIARMPITSTAKSSMLRAREGSSQTSTRDSSRAKPTMATTAMLVWRRTFNRLRRRRIFLSVSRRFSRVDDDIENLFPMRSVYHYPIIVICFLQLHLQLHYTEHGAPDSESTGTGQLNYPINDAAKASDYPSTQTDNSKPGCSILSTTFG